MLINYPSFTTSLQQIHYTEVDFDDIPKAFLKILSHIYHIETLHKTGGVLVA